MMATRQHKALKSPSSARALVSERVEERPAAFGEKRQLVDDDIVMTNRETAAYLKTTVEQMCRLRRSGKGPAFAQVGFLIRYRKSVVDAWLAGQTMTPAD